MKKIGILSISGINATFATKPPEEELPNVPTFKLRAKLLMEDRSYKGAIAVIVEASNYPFPNYMQDDLKKLLDKIRVALG